MRRTTLADFLCFLTLAAIAPGQQIDDFTFELDKLGGGKVRAADFAENVLIVDLWGTWCGPCRQVVPHLQRIYGKYKHHGLEVVGLNYERGSRAEQAAIARKFAAENGITYTLAIGDPAVQKQVPNFRGYPTMLFFDRGLKFSHMEVGFSPGGEKKIEQWVQEALGMAVAEAADEVLEQPVQPDDAADDDLQIPAGSVFQPGQGDKGFDFEVVDMNDVEVKFKDLRGKPVVLAMTTTWDPEAVNTAALLNRVVDAVGAKAHVLAASLELAREDAAKRVAIRKFMDEHELKYRVFPAGMGFQKKIHLFRGIPLFLVFDGEGTLTLRESSGTADELFEKITAAAGR